MNIGMLWFDNDTKNNLDYKLERAASYYQKKYGKIPTVCFVHPSMIHIEDARSENGDSLKETKRSCGMEVRSNQSVLPNHFWIGVNGTNHAAADS